jgi:hypothetical protein
VEEKDKNSYVFLSTKFDLPLVRPVAETLATELYLLRNEEVNAVIR